VLPMSQMTTITKDRTALTMSSREIAELLEVRHDNVKRTIERLADREVIELPPTEEHQTKTSHGRKHSVEVYLLAKRDSYVVVAQLSPEFTARVVDRWLSADRWIREAVGDSLKAAGGVSGVGLGRCVAARL